MPGPDLAAVGERKAASDVRYLALLRARTERLGGTTGAIRATVTEELRCLAVAEARTQAAAWAATYQPFNTLRGEKK